MEIFSLISDVPPVGKNLITALLTPGKSNHTYKVYHHSLQHVQLNKAKCLQTYKENNEGRKQYTVSHSSHVIHISEQTEMKPNYNPASRQFFCVIAT